MKRNFVSQDILMEILDYCPESGVLTWKPRNRSHFKSLRSYALWNKRYAGKKAGSTYHGATGYKCIQIDILGVKMKAHRVIWIYMTGDSPPSTIDHIDRDGTNNRWSNLRSGVGVNNYNMSKRRDNKSGVTGVSWSKVANMWHARVWERASGKRNYKHLGYYKDINEAKKVVEEFRANNGYSKEHGESLAPYVER